MPVAKTYKCGICSLSIGKSQGSLQCKICKNWLHATCANVSDKELKMLIEVECLTFICGTCDGGLSDSDNLGTQICNMNKKLDSFIKKHDDEQSTLNKKLDDFITKNEEDKLALRSAFLDAVAEIKSDMKSCVCSIKKDVMDCNKLINSLDSCTTAKFTTMETEINTLHRRLNRGDIVIFGLPEGLMDLGAVVVALGVKYNVSVAVGDVGNVCYINARKRILVKFNNVLVRDQIMKEYFKTRSLKICDLISNDRFGGDLENRVFLNDHYSPGASKLNGVCRNLLRSKAVTRFKIMNSDKLAAKLTLPDGKEVVYDAAECATLLNGISG